MVLASPGPLLTLSVCLGSRRLGLGTGGQNGPQVYETLCNTCDTQLLCRGSQLKTLSQPNNNQPQLVW
jgi:hypothetical protein